MTPVDLSVELGGLHLPNPILTASGTFGYGLEFGHLADLEVGVAASALRVCHCSRAVHELDWARRGRCSRAVAHDMALPA